MHTSVRDAEHTSVTSLRYPRMPHGSRKSGLPSGCQPLVAVAGSPCPSASQLTKIHLVFLSTHRRQVCQGPQDHDQRRRQVANALIRVIARERLTAASTRQVAAEARVSAGLVQRYFRTKDELLRFAFDRSYERTLERLRERSPRCRCGNDSSLAPGHCFPFDEARLEDAITWLTFLPQARHDAELGRSHVIAPSHTVSA